MSRCAWRARSSVTSIQQTAAEQAQADFDSEVREGQEPADIETIVLPNGTGKSLPKILLAAGLAESRTDAERKIKAGAVEIDGAKHTALTVDLAPGIHVFRVGKTMEARAVLKCWPSPIT